MSRHSRSYHHRSSAHHSHNHSDRRDHIDNNPQTNEVADHLSKVIRQLEIAQDMVYEERDYGEVLNQLSTAIASLSLTGKVILRNHMGNYLEAMKTGDNRAMSDIYKSFNLFRNIHR